MAGPLSNDRPNQTGRRLQDEWPVLLLCALVLLAAVALLLWAVRWPEPGLALAGHDIRGQFYPWLTTFREAIRTGSLPAWDRYQFAGYPFLSNPQLAAAYPPTWLAVLLPVHVAISWLVGFHLWLAGVGMLLYVRSVRGTWLGALLAAVTFALSGFFLARIWAGHMGMVATNAWLPWMLLATVWSVRRGDVWAGLLAGLPFGLALLAGHTTSALYLGLIWLAFAIYLGSDTGRWLLVGRQVVLAGVAGLGLAAVSLLPLLELTGFSTRALEATIEFALTYSLPLQQLAALVAPGYVGDPVQHGYWGAPTFEEMTYYAGVLPLVALLVALRKPTRLAWFYLLLIGIGLLLALGGNTPLYEPLAEAFAPFRLLRTPSRAAFLFVFAAAGLLGEVVSWLGRATEAERRALLRRWLWVVLAVIVVAGVATWSYLVRQPPGADGRLPQQIEAVRTATLLAGAGCGLLIAYLWARSHAIRWPAAALAAALVGLVAADLLRFGLPLVQVGPVGPVALWTDARALISSDDSRVLPWGVPIFDQNGAGEVGLRSIFGYNPIEIDRLIKLAAYQPDPRSAAYDVLSISQVVAPGPQAGYFEGDRPLILAGQTEAVAVHERARILPLARLVGAAEIIPDAGAALERLHQAEFDPVSTAILAAEPDCVLPGSGSEGTAALLEQGNGRYRIATSSAAPALLLLSETAYPGWRVTIDGERVDPLLAYTALQAVCLPAGEHDVVWHYVPVRFYGGAALSLLAALLLLAAAVLGRPASPAH